ncbi:DUF6264 family protein [Gryllotalpicola protaetiae]|uniref:Uncharacterized protein n=1 Tax=Gryllotalpicola protaetiae TaxID=2419771 RepID=A0A387BNL8_9MICO|nr:DUF6264 family protein [Gryllotalpicola protaetiae]AYG02587.1 hypothetical protein D7I44_02975 [Gryllotalpicola protaetiae]
MSDSGSDSERHRRPEYGEYATPEEQRAAIKQPAEWQLEGPEPHLDATRLAPQPPAPGTYGPGGPQHGGQQQGPMHWPQEESRPPQQPMARAGFGDRLVTFVLLGFGLSNVFGVVSDAFNGGQVMRESMAVMGSSYEQLANALPGWLWQGQAIIYGVVWLVTLFVSLTAMRAGRRSWWIPLLGAVVAGILFFAIFVIALGENPELLNILPSPSPADTGSST